jgi:membrane-associated phospholipid phosphatase
MKNIKKKAAAIFLPALFQKRRGAGLLLLVFTLQAAPDYNLDQRLFLKINGVRNAFFNGAAVVLSDAAILPNALYVYSLGYGYYRDKPEALNFGKAGLLTDAAVIAINQSLKAVVKRERPRTAMPEADGDYSGGFITRIMPSEKYSFPSQSASLSMSAAVLFSAVYPHWDKVLYTLAVLNGWAGVYSAAQYPGDVLAGEALGFGVAYGMLALLKKYDSSMDIRNHKPRFPIFQITRNL